VTSRTADRDGLAYGAGAYLLWGLFPLYWPLLEPAGAIEILAHRMIWSLVFVAILIAVRRQWKSVRAAVADRSTLWRLCLAAMFVSANWGIYIWGVNHHHVVETSLGYFINPLLTILLGVVVLKESLRPAQWTAVAIAAVAIVVLTVDYGRLPWIALALAFSFATYGFLKSRTSVGAIESLAIETVSSRCRRSSRCACWRGSQHSPSLIMGRVRRPCSPVPESSPPCRCCSSRRAPDDYR
jgi:chloramphenicol-sensitive protein RarD